jgi:hypothetical protein
MLTTVSVSRGSPPVSLARTSKALVSVSPAVPVSGFATGGLLAPSRPTEAVAVPVLKAVVPPVATLAVRSTVVPAVPLVSSQAG